MAKLYNLAAMTVASRGTGPITLGTAATIGGVLYLAFATAGAVNGETIAYSINDIGQSEQGTAVYSSVGPTITRTPVTSTNGNAPINVSFAAIVRISPARADIANLRETNAFTGSQSIGPSGVAPDSLLTINANTAATVTSPGAGTGLHVVGADGALNLTVFDAFGSQSLFRAQRANGTNAVKTAVAAGDVIFNVQGFGYDGAAYTSTAGAAFQILAAETFTTTNHGTYASVRTTPLGAAGTFSNAESTRFQPSGGVSIGATAIATDPGVGSLNVSGTLAVLSAALSTSPTTGALTVAGGVGVAGAVNAGGAITSIVNGASVVAASTGSAQAFVKVWNSTAGHVGAYLFETLGFAGIATTDSTGTFTAIPLQFSSAGVVINPNTASTTPTTGALVVAGGVGISGNVNIAPANVSFNANGLGIGGPTVAGVQLQISNAGSSQFRLLTTGAGAVDFRMVAQDGAGGAAILGAFSNHPLVLDTNGLEAIRLTTSKQLILNGALSGVFTTTDQLDVVAGSVRFRDTTASTSPTTGALKVGGGLGVAGAINAGAVVSGSALVATGPNSSLASGSAQFPTALFINPSTHATSRRTAIQMDNWALVQDSQGNGTKDFNLYNAALNQAAWVASPTTNAVGFNSTTASTSPTTGALMVAGGVGVAGSVNVGGGFGATGIITSASGFQIPGTTNVGGFTYAQLVSRFPTLGGQGGGALAWNFLAGNAEIDLFVNRDGGSVGGFAVWDVPNTSGAITNLMYVKPDGLNLPQTTASTSTTTGALTVGGGLGVAGAINAGTEIRSTNAAAGKYYSVSTGAGADAKKWQWYGFTDGAFYFTTLNDAENVASVAFNILRSGATATSFYIPIPTASTTTTTGALVVAGGVGIAGALNVGGTINGNTFTPGTYTLTGAAGKTLTFSNSLTFAGTDGTTQTYPPASGTVVTSASVNAVTNAMRSQMAALTLKGNATAGTANEADIDVAALPLKASPAPSDIVLIQDTAAANAFKRTTVSAMGAGGTVASIGGATGVILVDNGLSVTGTTLALNFVTVIDGIDNTGATDVGALINAAIQASPQFGVCILPLGIYQTSVTILVDGGRTLQGVTGGFHSFALDAGTCIRGNLALTPVVRLEGSGGSFSVSLKGIQITRSAGTIPTPSVGLALHRINNGVVEDCLISRHSNGRYLEDLNVGVRFTRVITTTITSAHYVIDQQAIEITDDNCRFGMNGTSDVGAVAYVVFNGGKWDTIRFTNCQWNLGQNLVSNAMQFQIYDGTNPNGIVFIDNLHCEGANANFIAFNSCTARIPRISICNSQINTTTNFFSAGSLINQMNISNTRINPTLTFDQLQNVVMAGCSLYANFTINAADGNVVTGNRFFGGATLAGACSKSIFVGNSVQGAITQTSLTGMVVQNNI